jgi:hypothetical protein
METGCPETVVAEGCAVVDEIPAVVEKTPFHYVMYIERMDPTSTDDTLVVISFKDCFPKCVTLQ